MNEESLHRAQPIAATAPNTRAGIVMEMVGANKDVLEISAPSDLLADVLGTRGCEVLTMVSDPASLTEVSRHGVEILAASFEPGSIEPKLDGRTFEAAVLVGSLERLSDPIDVLRQVRRALAPNGFAVVTVRNVMHADLRLAVLEGRFGYLSGTVDDREVHFFTRSALETLLKEAGLVPVELRRVIEPPEFATTSRRNGVLEAEALADPEADTGHFVVKAIRDDAAATVLELADRVRSLEDELHATRVALALRKCDDPQAHGRVHALQSEIDAIWATRIMRSTRLLRRMYHRLRRGQGVVR